MRQGTVASLLATCAAVHISAYPAEPDEEAPPPLPATPALAAEPPADAPEPPEALPPELDELLESTRRSVRSTTEWLARAVDGVFGDKSFDQGGKVSNGRLDLILHRRQGVPQKIDLRLNANFRLPNLESHVQFFVGSDDERDIVTDNPQAFSEQNRVLESRPIERSFFAGIKMPLLEYFEFRLGVHGLLHPFAQASFNKGWQVTEADVFEFRETLFWTVDDHLGSTTAGSYAHAFSPTLALRWLNSATITRTTEKFAWNSILGAYRTFGPLRVLALEGLLSGVQGSGVGVSEYGVQVRWEQPIHRTWLLGEIGVGHFWPRSNALSNRGRAWGVGANLKMKF